MDNKKLNSNHAGVVLVLSIVLMFAIPVFLDVIAVLFGWDVGSQAYEWVMAATSSIAVILAVIIISNKSDFSIAKALNLGEIFKKPSLLKRILLIMGICFMLMRFSSFILTYITAGLTELGFDSGIVSYPDIKGNIVIAVLVLAIFPAVSEEFLTRGVVLSGLKKGGYVYAIVMSALLFAVLHGNPLQLVHQFFLGAIFAYLVIISGSVLPVIFGHFFNNFLSVIAIAITPSDILNQPEATLAELLEPGVLAINIFNMLMAGALLILLLKIYTDMMLNIKNEKLILEKIENGGSPQDLNLLRSINKFSQINDVCMYLEGDQAIREPDKNSRLSKWLMVAIGIMVALWIANTLTGFGII